MSTERSALARELEEFAGDHPDLDAELHLRAAAALRKPAEIEVVEQGVLTRAPDGWSWDDVGPFTGWYSGIFLQRGEPILEGDGHFLVFRQGETSYTDRQRPIYRALSGVETIDEDGRRRHPVTVLVVHGFKGARSAYTLIKAGNIEPEVYLRDDEELTEFVRRWLKASHDDPIEKRKLPKRGPRKEKLDAA